MTAELGTVSSSAINVTVTAMLGGKTVATRVIAMAPATPLPSVKVGDTVMVRLVTAGLSVDCEGRVITAGVVGQTVSVSVSIYPGRPKTLTAVVKDANRVEVSS